MLSSKGFQDSTLAFPCTRLVKIQSGFCVRRLASLAPHRSRATCWRSCNKPLLHRRPSHRFISCTPPPSRAILPTKPLPGRRGPVSRAPFQLPETRMSSTYLLRPDVESIGSITSLTHSNCPASLCWMSGHWLPKALALCSPVVLPF